MPPKTVLITGCTPGGIGHALALEFHRHNLRVFATARDPSTLPALSAAGIETLPLEATSEDSFLALHAEITRRTNGTLDYLINNAGRNYTVPATDISMPEVQLTFQTNLFAVMRLCQLFTPQLIAAPGGGTIVQIGSLAGIMPYVFGSVYNASKAALHAYSDTLRVELRPFGVSVLTVVTGGVVSNIARTRRALPEGSLYVPVEAEYAGRQTHSQSEGVDAGVYARRVVGAVLGGGGRERVWEGGKAWVVWFAHVFLPRWVMDHYMMRTFKLWKLNGTAAKKVQ